MERGGYKQHATTFLKITDLLVGVAHGKYIVAEYIRDRPVLSQRPTAHCTPDTALLKRHTYMSMHLQTKT